jgi:hypothetical protein
LEEQGALDISGLRAGVRIACDRYRVSEARLWAALLVAIALLWSNGAQAADRVYLLRGWFGVFSQGMDELAAALRARGFRASAIGHTAWKSTVDQIVQERAAGKTGLLVLVGHSQGANNIIDMAGLLKQHNIPVDLLITLAPYMQDPVPANVLRAIDFYSGGGWGEPLTGGAGFHGRLSNIDVGADASITHINIDKSPRVQAQILRAITSLPRGGGQ